jgi:RHS repeat-associated protein
MNHSTGKERDQETGLDFFLARYYSGAQGRFLSPDEFKGGIVDPFTGKDIIPPGPLPYADITNPQSLNKYAYVYNNPLRYTDPDGHTALAGVWGGAAFGTFVCGPVCSIAGGIIGGLAAAYVGYEVGEAIGGAIRREQTRDSKPGTLGKPDHKETVKEEAERINGKAEQTIPTPGGQKDSRRPDAVGTNPATGSPEIVQVYRPTPAGNIPKREKDAAKDIQDATGIKPTMVPVRPLKPQQMPCTVTGTCSK